MIVPFFVYRGAALWFLFGMMPAQTPVPTAARSAVIQGIVAENATGRALENVEVWLERPERPVRDPLQPGTRPEEAFPFVTLTGQDGRFLLEGVPPGEYRLFADREGLNQQEYGQNSPETRGTVISVRAGERLRLDFRMLGAGTIAGRVIDDAGEPVSGIPVNAEAFQFRSGKQVLLGLSLLRLGSARRIPSVTPEMGYSVTNEEGAYRLTGLPPGGYYVVVRQEAGEETRAGFATIIGRDPAAPIYYPDTVRVDDAISVPVAGNEVSGIDIEWRPVPLVSVRGEVLGYEGELRLPLAVATPDGVRLARLSLTPPLGPDRKFELLLPPFQSYLLTARPIRPAGYFGVTRIDVSDSDREDIEVVLQPPATIHGQVVFVGPSGAPRIDLSELRVDLQTGWEGYSGSSLSFTFVRPDGTFLYQSVPREDGYRLSVEGLPEGYYLESAVWDGTDLLTNGLDLSRQVPGGSLTIRLGSGVGEIIGSVADARGTAHAGARVTLVPGGIYRNRYDRYRAVFSDADGRFRLEGVPPGPYQVFAWEAVPVDAEMNSEFLTPFLGRGRSVRVDRAGAPVVVELRVIEIPPGLSLQ